MGYNMWKGISRLFPSFWDILNLNTDILAWFEEFTESHKPLLIGQ